MDCELNLPLMEQLANSDWMVTSRLVVFPKLMVLGLILVHRTEFLMLFAHSLPRANAALCAPSANGDVHVERGAMVSREQRASSATMWLTSSSVR